MFTVSDTASTPSPAFVYKDLGDTNRREVGVSYELTPNIDVDGDIIITRFRGPSTTNMAELVVGEGNVFKLRYWNYATYPSQKTFLPFYPKDTTPNLNERTVFTSIEGTFRVSFRVYNAHTQIAEVFLFIERIGGRASDSYAGPLNWKFANVTNVRIGAIEATAPYDLSFDNISLNGDVPDPNWYSIKDYQGFKVDPLDEAKTWIGANDINDEETYSEPTSLMNLSRYDYAKASVGDTVTWGSDMTFEELKDLTFEGNFNLTSTPKGLKWHRS